MLLNFYCLFNFYFVAVEKKYIPFIVLFAVILLLPFSVQTVADLQGEKRFLSLDIFKDILRTPFKRESALNEGAVRLSDAWKNSREAIAAGADVTGALEPVVSTLSDLEASAMTVNPYAPQLDSGELDYKVLRQADTLLSLIEDEPELFPKLDSALKQVIHHYENFSWNRVINCVKLYGAWSGRYLRAFEKKVEDENALVLALRPKYQLAVWNVFGDPGEKVVLGSKQEKNDPWLYYRQDVEFLVQPSPLDVRSAKLDNPVQAITKFRDQLRNKGVELLVVVVPGKPSIYPENLTGGSLDSSYRSHGKKILDSLAASGFNTVDLYTPLFAAKVEDGTKGCLYLNDDTHWTPRGAELAADVIASKVLEMSKSGTVNIGEETLEYVVSDSLADRMGDIGEMSGLNKFNVFKAQQVTGHVVSQQVIKERTITIQDTVVADSADAVDVVQVVSRDSVVYDTSRTPFKDDFRKARILILGDSFSRIYQTDSPVNAGWISHFAKKMNRPVASIVSDGGASTLVREKLARKSGVLKGKKLLIWEFVERDLRFGAEGWKTVELN